MPARKRSRHSRKRRHMHARRTSCSRRWGGTEMAIAMMHRARVLAIVLIVGAALLWPSIASAQAQRFAVLVQGTTGGEPYASQHRKWLNDLVGVLRDKFGID